MHQNTILVVDDQRLMLDLILAILKPLPYEVITFTSPTAAVEFAGGQGENLGLLITDLRMDTMSGFELARQVQALCPKAKILFMSGAAPDEFDPDQPHSHEFILKPFKMADLKDRVAGLLCD